MKKIICVAWTVYYANLMISDIHQMWINYSTNVQIVIVLFCIIHPFSSAKGEAVLHSAHSEETLGGEEKAWDVLCATFLHYGKHQPCPYKYCYSKPPHRGAQYLTQY